MPTYKTKDGRVLTGWRRLPEFPNYEITQDGDVRNFRTKRLLVEHEDTNTRSWYYRLYHEQTGKELNRSYKTLLESAFPDPEWKDIPFFPHYQVDSNGNVRGKRLLRNLPKTKSGGYILRQDGRRVTWCVGELGNEEDWELFWNGEPEIEEAA